MTEHSPEQLDALEKIRAWYMLHHNSKMWQDELPPQVFRLFGYAGTGKTTLAKTIAAGRQRTLFAAYTGKAAQVLTRRGAPATTIHRLIYKPRGERIEYQRDEHGLLVLDDKGKPKPVPGAKPRPSFALDGESPLLYADLLVVDEVSMVDKQVGEDLLSFGKPILVLGDKAQLPPVSSGGFFTKQEPDVMLEQIHRQAEGSEVLAMATAVRNGEGIAHYNSCDYRTASKFDQVICGTNAMRWELNEEIRRVLGKPDGLPVEGDKIIVLQNNYDHNVMNGETFTVVRYDLDSQTVEALDDEGFPRKLQVWQQGFTREGEQELKEMPFTQQIDRVQATFAWAITCHKAQGSQWNNVLVVDESRVFRHDKRRWLYTAITRASKEVRVVNPGGMYARAFKPKPKPKHLTGRK